MKLVDYTFAKNDEFIVDATAGTLTFEVKGTLLGNPEDVQIQLGLKTVLLAILAGVTNPVLKWTLTLLINILA